MHEVVERTLDIRPHLQERLDEDGLTRIHDFLARESCWAAGIALETLRSALANSVRSGLGFTGLSEPERHMQRHAPDVYRRPPGD